MRATGKDSKDWMFMAVYLINVKTKRSKNSACSFNVGQKY